MLVQASWRTSPVVVHFFMELGLGPLVVSRDMSTGSCELRKILDILSADS